MPEESDILVPKQKLVTFIECHEGTQTAKKICGVVFIWGGICLFVCLVASKVREFIKKDELPRRGQADAEVRLIVFVLFLFFFKQRGGVDFDHVHGWVCNRVCVGMHTKFVCGSMEVREQPGMSSQTPSFHLFIRDRVSRQPGTLPSRLGQQLVSLQGSACLLLPSHHQRG